MRAASIRASRIGLPISSVMSCAICSTRRSIASAALFRIAARCGAGAARPLRERGGRGLDGGVHVRLARGGELADRSRTGARARASRRSCRTRLGRHSPPTKLANAGRAGASRTSDMDLAPSRGRSGRRRRRRGSTSVPIPGTWISTTWPGSSVKSSGGTSPVPVRRTLPGGTGLSRQQPLDELRERAAHAARVEVSPAKSSAPSASGDPQADLERRLPVVGDEDGRAERARAGEDLRLGDVERVLALDRARGDVVADRQAGEARRPRRGRRDLRLGNVPARVRRGRRSARRGRPCAGSRRPSGRARAARRRRRACRGPCTVALLDARVAAALVGDARAPDLGRLDRDRELVTPSSSSGDSAVPVDDPAGGAVAEAQHQ